MAKLRIIPLGGIGEIGKNMTAFEYGDDVVVVDCGSIFPRQDMLGIDLVIPDITYLTNNRERVRAYLFTHGHEDHIGAVPYVFPHVPAPAYGTKLTCALIRGKLTEHNISGIQLVFRTGPNDRHFSFENVKYLRSFIQLAHSQDFPKWIHTRVRSQGCCVYLSTVHTHSAKFIQREYLSMQTHSPCFVNYRAR